MQIAPVSPNPSTSVVMQPGKPFPMPPAPVLGIQGTPPSSPAPLINFPGIAAGNAFDIAKGSKVGMFSPTGSAKLDKLENDAAAFTINASAFGVKVDMLVSVQRLDATHVRITQQQAGKPATTADGTIVASRENYAEFLSSDGKKTKTVIQHDGKGQITIDTTVPSFGDAHLVLKKR
jgi:hypothetical protein